MAGFVAKKLCPHLKFVKLDFALYSSCSKAIMKVLGEYGEISPASLDEACELSDDGLAPLLPTSLPPH